MICLLTHYSVPFVQPPTSAHANTTLTGTIANCAPGAPGDAPEPTGITHKDNDVMIGMEQMGGYAPFVVYEPPELEARLARGSRNSDGDDTVDGQVIDTRDKDYIQIEEDDDDVDSNEHEEIMIGSGDDDTDQFFEDSATLVGKRQPSVTLLLQGRRLKRQGKRDRISIKLMMYPILIRTTHPPMSI